VRVAAAVPGLRQQRRESLRRPRWPGFVGEGRRDAERGRAEGEGLLAGIADFEPVTDPLTELQRVAGRAVRLVEVLEPVVAELKRIRYESQAEQVDGRVIVYERSLDRAGKILTDMARLNLDERLVRVSEAQGRLIIAAVAASFRELGLSADLQQALRPVVARHLRLVAAEDRERAALPAGGA
jgi:hypothetical protein